MYPRTIIDSLSAVPNRDQLTHKDLHAHFSTGQSILLSGSGRDKKYGYRNGIEYAKNYVPTEEDVLAARQQATEGMSQQQIDNLTEVVKTANLWLEHKYMNGDFFEQLSDPNNLYWNYFHQTGEIQIGWAVDGGLDMDAVCEQKSFP